MKLVLTHLLVTFIAAFITAEPNVTLANVQDKIRLLRPAFLLVEQLFDIEDKNLCLEKMLCLLEPEMPGDSNNPFKYFSRFLTNAFNDFDDMAFREVEALTKNYRKLSKIIDSIKYGQQPNSTQSCNLRYSECGILSDDLISFARSYDDESIRIHGFPTRGKRGVGCLWGVVGCGALGAGCLFCSAASGGACAVACTTPTLTMCLGYDAGCISTVIG